MLSGWHSCAGAALALPPGLVCWAPLLDPQSVLPTGQSPVLTGSPEYGEVDGRRCCTMTNADWMRVPLDAFEAGTAGPFTLACWFRFAATGKRVLAALGNYQTKTGTFSFYRDASRILRLTQAIAFGRVNNDWHHAVATYAQDGTGRLYLDGTPHAEGARSPFHESAFTDVTFGNNTSETYGGVTVSLADVRVYNRELSAGEAAELYGMTAGGTGT